MNLPIPQTETLLSSMNPSNGTDDKAYISSLVDSVPYAIMSRDIQDRLISWNNGAARMFGFTKEEALGKTALELGIIRFTPEEMKEIEDIFAAGRIYQAEKTYYRKDGSSFIGEATGNIVKDENGKVIGHAFIVKDITRRYLLEEQLRITNEELEEKVRQRVLEIRKTEQDYRYLFDMNPSPMWVIDQETLQFLNVNQQAVDIYGYSREEFLQMNAMDLKPEKDTHSFISQVESVEHKEGNYKGVWMNFKKNGERVYIEVITNPIVFNGRDCWLAMAIDITERREIALKLIQSENRYRDTLDNMLEGVQILDYDYRYLYVNKAVVKQSRTSAEELLGYSLVEKFPGVEQTELFRVIRYCMTERVSLHMENKFVYPDGVVSWFELSLQPVPEGVFILSVDITESVLAREALKKERNKLASLAEVSPGLIYSFRVSPTGEFSLPYASHAFEEIYGYTLEEANADINLILEMSCQSEKDEVIKSIMESLTNLTPWKGEFQYKHPRKGLIWIAAHSIPVREEDGGTIWHGVVLDITERKESEQRIRELNNELELKVQLRTQQLKKANEELEAFSYSVSHDLRAPLRSIIGFASILEEEYAARLDDEARRITGIIKESAISLGKLIDDLLMFSRMGRHEISRENFDTNELVAQVLADLKLNNPAQFGKVNWHLHNLPQSCGDLSMLKQVWVNLLGNAVKYSARQDNPMVEIGSRAGNRERIFYVKDNGTGFDQQYAHKLFKVFQRLHSPSDFEGTGVGLATVEKIISKHGGRVWAEGIPGEGACFYFSLPCEQSKEL